MLARGRISRTLLDLRATRTALAAYQALRRAETGPQPRRRHSAAGSRSCHTKR